MADDDRLRLPAASPSRSNSAEKKESTDPRLSQLCPPYVTPSSSSSLEYHRSDARIVENGFAAGSGMSNSAKVGLVSVDLGEINHNLMPTHSSAGQLPVTASLKKRIEPNLEATAAIHQAELERERERAERLMSELLRAKADALAARATVTRL